MITMWFRSCGDLDAVSNTCTHTLMRTGWSAVFLWCFRRIVSNDENSPERKALLSEKIMVIYF